MTQIELKDVLKECGNTEKLKAVKTVMDYLNQGEERVIGLKEAKDIVDKHWGSATQLVPTNVVGIIKDMRDYKKAA